MNKLNYPGGCITQAQVVTLKDAVMRVNHGFIAVRRRLYGKHVCSLSSVTAFRRRGGARAHTYVTAHIFRRLNAEGRRFNTDIILPAYSLSATFADATFPHVFAQCRNARNRERVFREIVRLFVHVSRRRRFIFADTPRFTVPVNARRV